MFRYMVFVWNELDDAQAQTAHRLAERLHDQNSWSSALHASGVRVFVADTRRRSSEVHLFPDAAGVVLGTVFEPAAATDESGFLKRQFTPDEAREALRSGCTSLLNRCWGRYVAITHDAPAGKVSLLRDPTGGLPCYRTHWHGVHIFFSNIEDLDRLGAINLAIDWDYIRARVAFVFLNTPSTAFKQVTEVLAGERVEIDRGTLTASFAWNPFQVATMDVIEDIDTAASELRRVSRACIHAWAGCYDNILQKLSGGLDSSIVLACLRDAPTHPGITCLNYYSHYSNGDERRYARLAAQSARVPLLEWERNDAVQVQDLIKINRSPAPTFYLGPLQTSAQESRLAREIGATAYFGGAGGDQLFYQAHGILTAADYLRRHGIDRRFFEISLDAAHLEHCTIWKVMLEAYRRRRSSPVDSRGDAIAGRQLVSEKAIALANAHGGFLHPLLPSAASLPPGKLWHAYGLSVPLEFYDPLGKADDPEPVQPLISQPLIELCLRIPTYVLTNSGWDRALARQAFRDDVPREILRRRNKGGMEEHVQQILLKNLGIIRELLLDGVLAQAGLLERARLNEVLSERPTDIASGTSEIFDHLSVEVWLRRWNASP